jgi:hypothetical protein
VIDVLAVVGSTEFACLRGFALAHQVIHDELVTHRPDALTSGGADGVDTLAETLAGVLHIPTRIYPPRVRRWAGPSGYRERNQRIADTCTRALRIVCANSTTYGSGWTCERVREHGNPVRTVVIHPDGRTVDSGWVQPVASLF